MIGMYCDVSLAKKQLIELVKGMDDSQGLFLNQFYAYVFLFCGLAVENSNCRQQFVTQFKKCLVTLDSIL